MQIGISQLILSKIPVREFLDQSAAAGYRVVELVVRKEGEITPDTPAEALREIVNHAHTRGLDISSVCLSNRTGNLLAGGDDARLGIEETAAGLQTAARLGARVALHTLGRLTPETYYEDAYANTVQALRKIVPACESIGVDIAIEFVWNGFLFSPLEMRRLIEDVGSPRIGFYFDPGNMAVFHPPQHWVRALGRHIKMVHMKDWKGRALNGGWTALLAGEVNFPIVMKELRAADYGGPLVSEVEPSLAPLADTCEAIAKIAAM